MKKRSNVIPGPRSTWFIAAMLAFFASLLTGTYVNANNQVLSAFQSQYPTSSSDNNAACQLCHGSESSKYNEYGELLRRNGYNFSAVESVISVNINGTTTMLDEINAGTQPGWTTGANNNLYQGGDLISDTDTAPDTINGDLDPNAPPVADAGGEYNGTAGIAVDFDGSGSSDPDGTIDSYDWDFGDGNTSVGVSPSHTYDLPGDYTVTLTVTDNDGAKDTDSTTAVIVTAPEVPVADPGGPYTGLVGFELTFDGSGSFDPDGGGITAYDWDFGDGNVGTGATPTHTYNAAGTYTVTLTVVDDEGAQSLPGTTTAVINVPRDPVADANGPYEGFEGVELTLDGSGSSDPDGGAIAEYNWDFGDGNTGTGLNPTHTYATAGTYTITLTVVDDEGASGTDTTEAVIALPPDNLPPLADPGGPYKGTAGKPVNFDGSASSDPDGNIVQYDWYWGDGSADLDAGPTPTHTYKASGKYDVELKVTDDDGDSDNEFTLVEVTTGSSNGGCSIGGRGTTDPTLPLLVLVALLYLNRRRVCQDRICDLD
jgi:PKD repeat protein